MTLTSTAYVINDSGPTPLIDADYLVIEVDGEPLTPEGPPRRLRSHRFLWLGLGSIVALGALGLGYLTVRARR